MQNPPLSRSVHRVVRAAAALFFFVGTLSGCVAAPAPSNTAEPVAVATPAPTAPTAPTAAPPIFASNDEALAAATAAYGAYATLSDDVMTHKTSLEDSNALSASVSATYLPQVLEGLTNFTKNGHWGQGDSTFDSVTLVRYLDTQDGHADVEVYICSDVSGLRLLDASGADVTPTDRLDRIPLQVRFISSDANPSHLLVDKEDVWSGRNFC